MKDIIFRTGKCFIFAFLGVFIPEICCILSGTLPPDFHSFALLVIPMLCASLSSGLSASWSFFQSKVMSSKQDVIEVDGEIIE